MLSLDSVFLIKYRSGKLNKSPSGSGRTHFTDEVQVQFAGGPLPFLTRRNLRPEFLVRGVGFFRQLRGRQGFRERQHGIRNVFQGIAELAHQVLLHALGVKEQLNLVNKVPEPYTCLPCLMCFRIYVPSPVNVVMQDLTPDTT